MNSSRENILNRLKQAHDRRDAGSVMPPDFESPIYNKSRKSLADQFQENLELVSGKVFRVINLEEAITRIKQISEQEKWSNVFCLDKKLQSSLNGKLFYRQSPEDFRSLQAAITPCEFLVAHLGSVLVSSNGESGRRLYVFPETHLVIAHQGQLVEYLDEALIRLQEKYDGQLPSMITNITGPSRTADIEKTLIKGMHGPRKLLVFLCDEPF